MAESLLPKRTIKVGDQFSLVKPNSRVVEKVVYKAATDDKGERVLWLPGDGPDLPLKIVAAQDDRQTPNGQLPKRKLYVGDQFSLAKPGERNPIRVVYTLADDDAGERILWMPDGDDLPLTIERRGGDDDDDDDEEEHDGVTVESGGNVQKAVDRGGVVKLVRGGTYSGDVKIKKNDTTIIAASGGSGALPRLKGKVIAEGKSKLKFAGIQPDGFKLYNVKDVAIKDCVIIGSRNNGINCEGEAGKRSKNVKVSGTVIADCYPASGDDRRQGLYASFTDDLSIDGCVFDGNGWKKTDPRTATEYSHNIYINANCGPVSVTNTVLANASAHGLQQRSGGTCRGNIFIDNPIGMSYGLVNGSPCHDGGVTGTVSECVYIGGRDIKGGDSAGARGWAIELDNIKAATVSNVIIAHDNQKKFEAVHVGGSKDVTGRYVRVQSLKIEKVCAYDWKKSVYKGWPNGEAPIVPNNPPDLRATIGDRDFLKNARINPKTAAAKAWQACKSAIGW